MRAHGRFALLCLVLLSGCWSGPVSLDPLKRAPDFIAHKVLDPSTGAVFEDGAAIGGGHLTIRTVKASGERLAGAQVALLGFTPAGGTTFDTLDLTLEPLLAGTYSVRVSAPGYATQLHPGVMVDPANPAVLTCTMEPSGGDVLGRVLDSSQSPVAGAWVSAGESVAFSGSDGRFRLSGVSVGAQTLAVGKAGLRDLRAGMTVGAAETNLGDLAMTPGTRVVSFENPTQAFAGQTIGVALSSLRAAIEADGFTVQNGASTADIRVVASPTQGWLGDAAARAESLRTFVASGGKLILMGEWGGCSDYSPGALNRLAQPFGMSFNPDLLRLPGSTPTEWLRLTGLSGVLPAVTSMPNGLQLFEACSIFAPGPAVAILGVGESGYRVASILTGNFTVAAARPYGRGLVIALGDTSAWITPGTRNAHADNLEEASNRAFILNVFRW